MLAQSVVPAAELSFRPAPGLLRVRTTVESLQERRWKHVVRQGVDISCGSAALSTILQYQFGDKLQESVLIRAILKNVKPEEVRKRGGFSLLDLKRAATTFGYNVQGYKLPLEALSKMGTPAIVVLSVRGRRHFVVFRGVAGDRVVLADPAFGNLLLRDEEFKTFWQGVALVLRKNGKERARSLLTIRQDDLTMIQRREAAQSLNRGAIVYTVMGPDEFK